MSQERKGRNLALIQHRNEKLLARFYYYNSLLGLKFSLCLKNLVLEFDLSNRRIYDIITNNSEAIKAMELSQVSVDDLRKRYSFMSWHTPLSTPYRTYQQLS